MNISGFSGDDVASRFEPWLAKQGGAITEAKGPNGERIELKYDICNRVVERRVQRNGFRLKIWKYEWDAKDRLIATTTPEGERWTYGYDPFGRRIHKINAKAAKAAIQLQNKGRLTAEEKNRGAYYEEPKNHNYPTKDGKIIVGTSYLWDGNTIAEEADMLGDGSTDWDNATRWHYEPDTFRPIAKEPPDGDLLYIVTDHLGTPREMFSEDGHLQWAAQYRTWGGIKRIWTPDNDDDQLSIGYPPNGGGRSHGNLAVKYDTVEAQAAQDCPIRFQGQWEDAETGLYYNRFRTYDPLAGQYLSSDPIGLTGGLRSNGYVGSPTSWVDPWGLVGKNCCADVVRELAQQIPCAGEKYQCNKFREELVKKMQDAGINGQVVNIRTPGHDAMPMLVNGKDVNISTNGFHTGVKVGDTIFDNINPSGINYNQWLNNIGITDPFFKGRFAPIELIPF